MNPKEFYANFMLNVIAGLIGGLIVGLLLLKEYNIYQRVGALIVLIIILWLLALAIYHAFLRKSDKNHKTN